MKYQLPTWMRRRRGTFVHILADEHLSQWPIGDIQCKISYMPHQSLSQWVEKIRNRVIVIKAQIVVIYFQKFKGAGHLTPLKNQIAQVCRAIRGVQDCRIFICDTLPAGSGSMLDEQMH